MSGQTLALLLGILGVAFLAATAVIVWLAFRFAGGGQAGHGHRHAHTEHDHEDFIVLVHDHAQITHIVDSHEEAIMALRAELDELRAQHQADMAELRALIALQGEHTHEPHRHELHEHPLPAHDHEVVPDHRHDLPTHDHDHPQPFPIYGVGRVFSLPAAILGGIGGLVFAVYALWRLRSGAIDVSSIVGGKHIVDVALTSEFPLRALLVATVTITSATVWGWFVGGFNNWRQSRRYAR